jgi:nucleotide-binding universal stress UspA family protein
MFKKIVWATDGSESADNALEIVKTLAAENNATLVVVHAVEYQTGPGARGGFPQHADEDAREAKIAKQAEELNATLKITHSGSAGAAHTIADVAVEEGADLIVVGTRGHTALSGLLLGSVTQRLLHIASCPVLAVPPKS